MYNVKHNNYYQKNKRYIPIDDPNKLFYVLLDYIDLSDIPDTVRYDIDMIQDNEGFFRLDDYKCLVRIAEYALDRIENTRNNDDSLFQLKKTLNSQEDTIHVMAQEINNMKKCYNQLADDIHTQNTAIRQLIYLLSDYLDGSKADSSSEFSEIENNINILWYIYNRFSFFDEKSNSVEGYLNIENHKTHSSEMKKPALAMISDKIHTIKSDLIHYHCQKNDISNQIMYSNNDIKDNIGYQYKILDEQRLSLLRENTNLNYKNAFLQRENIFLKKEIDAKQEKGSINHDSNDSNVLLDKNNDDTIDYKQENIDNNYENDGIEDEPNNLIFQRKSIHSENIDFNNMNKNKKPIHPRIKQCQENLAAPPFSITSNQSNDSLQFSKKENNVSDNNEHQSVNNNQIQSQVNNEITNMSSNFCKSFSMFYNDTSIMKNPFSVPSSIYSSSFVSSSSSKQNIPAVSDRISNSNSKNSEMSEVIRNKEHYNNIDENKKESDNSYSDQQDNVSYIESNRKDDSNIDSSQFSSPSSPSSSSPSSSSSSSPSPSPSPSYYTYTVSSSIHIPPISISSTPVLSSNFKPIILSNHSLNPSSSPISYMSNHPIQSSIDPSIKKEQKKNSLNDNKPVENIQDYIFYKSLYYKQKIEYEKESQRQKEQVETLQQEIYNNQVDLELYQQVFSQHKILVNYYFENTSLLSDNLSILYMIKWFCNNNQRWSLLYCGTRDHFNINTFHKNCDNRGKTVTLIKYTNKDGYVNLFGGYTSLSWNGSDGIVEDPESIVFQLQSVYCTSPRCFINENLSHSIGHYSNIGPFFSKWFAIPEGCHERECVYTSYCSEFHTESCSCKSILTDIPRNKDGFALFHIDEIEVFACKE
ncbi:hypothetical protein WA158_000944 [Blastocystis sp. Blastoise]